MSSNELNRIRRYMGRSIELALDNVRTKQGGPFGAVVADGEHIIATGTNRVTRANDPTAHAEIIAIRSACDKLKSFSLAGCDLISSCEPCPMCYAAAYWARVQRIWYAATRDDAERAHFDDADIYRQIALAGQLRSLPAIGLMRDEGWAPFQAWLQQADRINY